MERNPIPKNNGQIGTDDKKFKLYINSFNKKVWEAIEYCQSKNISPSDYICRKVIEGFMTDGGGGQIPINDQELLSLSPNKPLPDLLDSLISLAVDYEQNGINGLDISYLLPRRFDQGKISKEDMINLVVFAFKLYITIINTGNMRYVLADIDPVSSKRDITSKPTMEMFKEHLESYLNPDAERIKLEDEKRERERVEKEKIRLEEERLLKVKQEKHDWELLHPDIPFYQKDMTFEQREVENKLLSGDYTIIGSDEELQELESEQYVYFADAKYETLEKDPAYKSEYYPALEKYLNLIERHIN